MIEITLIGGPLAKEKIEVERLSPRITFPIPSGEYEIGPDGIEREMYLKAEYINIYLTSYYLYSSKND